jgi:hypothetical protein
LVLVQPDPDAMESIDDFDLGGVLRGYEELGNPTITWNGDAIDVHALRFNTTLATGSQLFAVMARLEASCKQHVFVEADDVKWFRDVIRRGRETSIFQPDRGWEDVVALCDEVLAAQSSEPLVTSWSFARDFPNPLVAFGDREEGAAWDAMAPEEQWTHAVAGTRRESDRRRIAPEPVPLGDGRNAFDLGVYLRQEHHRRLMSSHRDRLS